MVFLVFDVVSFLKQPVVLGLLTGCFAGQKAQDDVQSNFADCKPIT